MTLDLTAEEWLALCDPEGELLPACCANISELRDCILDLIRDGRRTDGFAAARFLWAYGVAVATGHPFAGESAVGRLAQALCRERGQDFAALQAGRHTPAYECSRSRKPNPGEVRVALATLERALVEVGR